MLDRLLVAKGLLGPIRFAQTHRPDRISLARQILAAHDDAADLALAAVARHLGSLPQSSQTYLMDHFPVIPQARPTQDVPGRDKGIYRPHEPREVVDLLWSPRRDDLDPQGPPPEGVRMARRRASSMRGF